MISQLIDTGFKNALKICMDELFAEPKRILIIGGCRQRDFARYMALLLPAVEMYVLDSDAAETQKAREEICCRFKFVTAPLENLPFENDFFDFTIGHHLFEQVENWEQAMREIGRVTTSHFMVTTPRPNIWKFLCALPGGKTYFSQQGLHLPPKDKVVEKNMFLRHLNRYAKIALQVSPWPWEIYMAAMKPIREDRLILEEAIPAAV